MTAASITVFTAKTGPAERLGAGANSPDSARAPLRVLLIGSEPAELRGMLDRVATCDQLDSFVEAILHTRDAAPYDLVLAGITQELDQLQKAVQTFRDVHPAGLLILVCEPCYEAQCVRAISWGVSDYLIAPVGPQALAALVNPALRRAGNGADAIPAGTGLPVNSTQANEAAGDVKGAPADANTLLPRSTRTAANSFAQAVESPARFPEAHVPAVRDWPIPTIPAATSQAREALSAVTPRVGAETHGDASLIEIDLLKIPLIVQMPLIDEILHGHPEFANRAVAILQTHVRWPGTLRFVPAEVPPPVDPEAAVADGVSVPIIHENTNFGNLALDGPRGSAAILAQLDQAATWLAGFFAMARQQENLRRLSITDELSGAYNRRYFYEWTTRLLEKATQERFRVTLLWFDIDNFKSYNDKHGHAAGDLIIREVVGLLNHCKRTHDLAFRVGGDEFAVIFWDKEAPRQPNSQHPRSVLEITDRFANALANHPWSKFGSIQGCVSISGGLATFPWDAATLEGLIDVADKALLRAKAGGKNVILLSEEKVAAGNAK